MREPWARYLVRLSIWMRCPLSDVLAWPMWQIDAYTEFFRREFPVEERIEAMLADLSAMFANVNRRPGAPSVRARDFLLCRGAWTTYRIEQAERDGRYSELDLEVLRAFK